MDAEATQARRAPCQDRCTRLGVARSHRDSTASALYALITFCVNDAVPGARSKGAEWGGGTHGPTSAPGFRLEQDSGHRGVSHDTRNNPVINS
jgi:hypothetical protein